jgi:hypothetical protein
MKEPSPLEIQPIERRKGGRRQTDVDGAFNDGYKLSSFGSQKTWIGWTLWAWRVLALIVGSWVMAVAIFNGISTVFAHLSATLP